MHHDDVNLMISNYFGVHHITAMALNAIFEQVKHLRLFHLHQVPSLHHPQIHPGLLLCERGYSSVVLPSNFRFFFGMTKKYHLSFPLRHI